ncbi:MAG: cold shock domain-containing protein, partial [bacterium]
TMLKEEFHYEVDVFPINYYGRRLRPDDRDPDDRFEPKEKCVDIALATSVLFYAAMPYAYDIAIAVVGDRDFIPVFQAVRRLGKRVAIASIHGCCAADYFDLEDRAHLRDLDVIWLDDLLDKLELRYEPQLLICESPFHSGDRKVWTTFRPRKGQRFYCDTCRREFQEQHDTNDEEDESGHNLSYDPEMPVFTQEECYQDNEEETPPGDRMTGCIKTIKRDKGYGFIAAEDGKDYFFHLSELAEELDWETLEEDTPVQFDTKTCPSEGKAGAAAHVTLIDGEYPPDPSP